MSVGEYRQFQLLLPAVSAEEIPLMASLTSERYPSGVRRKRARKMGQLQSLAGKMKSVLDFRQR